MELTTLANAGNRTGPLSFVAAPLRRMLFRMTLPYWEAMAAELSALHAVCDRLKDDLADSRRQIEADRALLMERLAEAGVEGGVLFDRSDLQAIRNRLADIEDRLTSSR